MPFDSGIVNYIYLLRMKNTTQKLNLFSLTMIVIGFVIGMGIFRTAATSAKDAISPSVYFSAWAIGGLVALCGALTYAEIGSRYPVTGGYYKVFAKAYHPSIAFAINCIILVSNAASISGVALIGSGYLLKLFPGNWTDIDKALVSSAAIIVFYLINLKGLKTSSTAQNILMMIKITMVIVLISALFFPDKYAVGDAAKAVAVQGHPRPPDHARSLGRDRDRFHSGQRILGPLSGWADVCRRARAGLRRIHREDARYCAARGYRGDQDLEGIADDGGKPVADHRRPIAAQHDARADAHLC